MLKKLNQAKGDQEDSIIDFEDDHCFEYFENFEIIQDTRSQNTVKLYKNQIHIIENYLNYISQKQQQIIILFFPKQAFKININNFHIQEIKSNINYDYIKPFQGISKISINKFILTGGKLSNQNIFVEIYEKDIIFTQKKNMLTHLHSHQSQFLRDFLYIFGGFDGQNYVNNLYRYDLKNDQWNTMQSMNQYRCSFGSFVDHQNNLIYAIGGHHNMKYLDCIEQYSVQLNKWSYIKLKLPQPMNTFATIQINEKLVILGGFNGQTQKQIIQIDFNKQEINFLSNLQYPRRINSHNCFQIYDQIFVLGGYSKENNNIQQAEIINIVDGSQKIEKFEQFKQNRIYDYPIFHL